MRRRKKADRAGLHAGRPAWAVGLVRGRGRAVSSRAASRGVVAAARTPGQATARVHPRRHNQDPDPVPSRVRPGAAATSRPLHERDPAPVAARSPERDPGRAPSFGFLAGCGRHASGLAGVAGGFDDPLHLARRSAAAAAVAGVGQSGWPQDARAGAVAVRAWGHAALHARGGSWLNMAESIERVLKRRALDGQHPHSPEEIGSWFEQTARCWNEQPTPFVWNGKRRQRRRRSGGEPIYWLGGSGACTHRPLRRSRSAGPDKCQTSQQTTH